MSRFISVFIIGFLISQNSYAQVQPNYSAPALNPSGLSVPGGAIYNPYAAPATTTNSDLNTEVYDPAAPITNNNIPGTTVPYQNLQFNNDDNATDPSYYQVKPTTNTSGTGTSSATSCTAAALSTQAECVNGSGVGATAASGINTAAGGVTIINQAAPTANQNCSSAEYTALANNAGTGIVATACYMAYTNCQQLCSGPYYQATADTCAAQFSAFKGKLLAQAAQGALQVALALKCQNATNPTTPTIPGGPGYQGPQVTDPGNKGLQALGPGAPKGPDSQGTDGLSGAPAPGGAAYPGGAAATNQAKNEASGVTSPTLGLSNGGGGGGWPTGTAGAGNPGAPGGAAPFDLSALLPGHAGDPSRGPASVASEVTGANDLSNFQKVTRMMNKKRPVLKSGDGA